MWPLFSHFRRQAKTSKTLMLKVNKLGHLTTLQHSAGKLWIPAFTWAPLGKPSAYPGLQNKHSP